ncbi:hypothetical protein N7495_002602 [Penicillium taxi]|uniref:uncharacterized protein n=1 Tax=Penicillium taxi TaxID=168475 RepID=UPI002544E9A0|nr:uncharacterized protein N7495_002602 [Penicillium taxi]KAJ5902074.1 hypothetical protein N7495_002602 [Penicillium taxi]
MSSPRKTASDESLELSLPWSFVELMALESLGVDKSHSSGDGTEEIEKFRSLAAPYPPGQGSRSFGGHVYAQSAYAASKTVGEMFVIHDITGSFILGGRLDIPYIYSVRRIRDGFMYCTRAVDARQDGKICFSCLCSFKRGEGQQTFHHQPPTVQERFDKILSLKRPEDQDMSPSIDADFWIEGVKQGKFEEMMFPGLDVRKVNMEDYNNNTGIQQNPERYRQLTQYRLKGSPDEDCTATLAQVKEREFAGKYDNLYACAHMYSSDKNSLFLIPRALGIKRWADMSSLTLMVVVHTHGKPLRMIDWDGVTEDKSELPMKWFIQEGWTPQSGENRAVHESHLWSPEGTLIATSLQDSMLRLQKLGRAGNL